MAEKTGVSTNNLVEAGHYGKSKKLPQYIAALSVCMGSVAAGTVLGWTGNITKEDLAKGELNDILVDPDNEYGWIGSFSTLGALCMCFPIGFICDLIGRKLAMLLTIIPFSIGWLLIIFADSTAMIFAGRFLTGLAGGAFCVSAPMYSSEIADKDIRGALGSYFQLLLTVGILFAYLLGAFVKPQIVSIICACVPLVFGVVFFLQPETPVYSLKKGNEEAAIKALRKLRGDEYNVEAEVADIKATIEKAEREKIPLLQSLETRAAKISLLICFGLMFFQQLGGINAVIFYVGTIFEEADSGLSASDVTILVGVMQVIATFVSSLVIDKFGRKILLLISGFIMAIAGILLGIYFSLKDNVSGIGFLPILGVCIFIIVFSLGFGPIPWMISSEVFPAEIKSNASSAAGTFNWFLAFLVTKFYGDLAKEIGTDVTFYIFSGVSLVGVVFIFFIVPETKGKTLDEIQRELNGEKTVARGIDNEGFNS
ncbi:facilitated trehalose transporter Tret1-like isoform X1 [Tribolium madens]|uniref:facilitated trehalose transporter Tret1-like isoform X1 n=2 Tax=Tribolium madens TaxID=41895 RepID=UPI001CF753D3|nr:facilitated trehalose transporter Tret1-like isoform X1 [Tribolium madens]XP_044269113.1 facilitated trehalose transporter Tret1-like isoform X1 [Tribolium madens]XP_044269116.1 facilitated trehalose transporter Tret1-like isoform X1 [Tribolium madens]XP_044269117.1 facilitated trehalose transporter Tret1-like isoform X1 [Tribolium madens]XP_044269118.1 facilitated trehalose transporter Tret1-like isoform X1 [Tribolium madens]XP_044269119.1 facilitated trehalose transporter Tret1-like isofo